MPDTCLSCLSLITADNYGAPAGRRVICRECLRRLRIVPGRSLSLATKYTTCPKEVRRTYYDVTGLEKRIHLELCGKVHTIKTHKTRYYRKAAV